MPAAPSLETSPAPRSVPVRPELLSPAGDWECARAAVENGADAIYFGLERFNARMRADNFTVADLPPLMDFLHRRGVKGYVTFNILVFPDELAEAEKFLRAIISSGVDAAIVQDVGICRLIRRLSPDFPIHASTQMTVTSAAGVEFARQIGCRRVVLARECSLKEIAAIHSAAPAPDGASEPARLEIFVHGALCVAYSGQCLTSEALGGRSANRGECAQACRLPYELLSDGKLVPLGDRRYLLSPQDLAGLEFLPGIVEAGVSALKIEGRLKSPEYVANITRVYREALNQLTFNKSEAPTLQNHPDDSRYDLEMAFSRGLYSGWLGGTNNQALVHARFGKKRGVFLGEIANVSRDRVQLELTAPLKPGDGVVFDSGHPDQDEEGGRVYSVEPSGKQAVLQFGSGDVDFSRIHTGDKLWKTSDPELDKRLRRSFAGQVPQFQRPVAIRVEGAAGQPLELIVAESSGLEVRLESKIPLQPAENQALDETKLREQLGRLGGTPFSMGALENNLLGRVMLPVSELNRLRRDAVAQLENLRMRPRRWTLVETPTLRPETPPAKTAAGIEPELIVLVRNLEQLQVAIESGIKTIYCEFENPKKYRDAVDQFRSAPAKLPGSSIFVAPPRIYKNGEEWILKQVRSSEPDGYLVRNYDHLNYFAGSRCVGDYSLNVANHLTAEYFLESYSLERVTASYDLNAAQLEGLIRSVPSARLEITLHQHMPMFHMEHCVFCAFLSQGTDYTNCGRPCDSHDVKLRDRAGAEHPLKADAGCRNTVFNSLAQTGAEYASKMLALGARYFRIEFLNESGNQARDTIESYQHLLRGKISGNALWRQLKLNPQLGVTRGPMGG